MTGSDSCSTKQDGACTIKVQNVDGQSLQSLTVTQLTDARNDGVDYTYDDDQDVVDQIVVDKQNTKTFYLDGELK